MVLQKVARLAPHDRRLVLRAALLVVLVRAALWLLPLATVRRWASKPKKTWPRAESPLRVAWAVRRVSGFVPQATCLVQAISTQTLLAQMGMEAQLHIGVALDKQGQFIAHAWVEHDGQVVIGGDESTQYASLLALDQLNLPKRPQ